MNSATLAPHHVPSLWDDAKAASLDPVDLLVYASNCLGADPRVTNFGGGNTSSKVTQTDPLTGDAVEVLWVKGSGGDLGTAKRGTRLCSPQFARRRRHRTQLGFRSLDGVHWTTRKRAKPAVRIQKKLLRGIEAKRALDPLPNGL